MIVALKLCVGILWWLVAVQADVSHLGYRQSYKGERLRLQRLESELAPYPAAGYRPNREFGLPQEQPLFPLANKQGGRPFGSSGFNNLGESQSPQLTYGSPPQDPRFRSQIRPQKFNNADEPQEQVFIVKYHQRPAPAQTGFNNFERPQHNNGDFSNDFNNFAEDQQYDSEEHTTIANQQPQNDFNNLAQPQQPHVQPDLVYGAPNSQEQEAQSARLRQHLIARLQRAERLEQLQKQAERQTEQEFVNAPQLLYSTPSQRTQLQAQSQISRLIAQKPARLTDNREETEIESDIKAADTEEIETTTKADDKKTVAPTAVPGNIPAAVANTGVVGYYPAAAIGFVQPLNAAASPYLATANYQTVQPFSAAYAVGAPYLPQQYVVAAGPAAQLKAW